MKRNVLNDLLKNMLSHQKPDDDAVSKIYKIHKYWARKPWFVIQQYIRKYSKKGDLVLDPFCGSGVIGLEAICNDRNFIGGDINPISLLISQETLNADISILEIEQERDKLKKACEKIIMDLYRTECICEKCHNFLAINYVKTGKKFASNNSVLYCPICKSKKSKTEVFLNNQVNIPTKKTLWSPNVKFPEKFYKDRFSNKGISTVEDMYTARNWYALGVLYDAIDKHVSDKYKDLFKIAFSNTLLHVSKLKGENIRPLGVNNYWIPDDNIEENVWFRFEERLDNVIQGKEVLLKRVQSNKLGSASVVMHSALEAYPAESFDYIFTDPPYGDVIQYSELSYIWNAWLNAKYDTTQEIIINPAQNKKESDFTGLLNMALENIYNALKVDGYFTLCFQNKNFRLWKNIITKCKKLGFHIVNVDICDFYGHTFNRGWATFSPKCDIYVTFQKTFSSKKHTGNELISIDNIIKQVVDVLQLNHQDVTLDKVYNLLVGYVIWLLYEHDDINLDFSLKTIQKELFKYNKCDFNDANAAKQISLNL